MKVWVDKSRRKAQAIDCQVRPCSLFFEHERLYNKAVMRNSEVDYTAAKACGI